MNEKSGNILFSCVSRSKFETEQVVKEHALVCIESGTLEFTLSKGKVILEPGNIALVKRNQLAKAKKNPSEEGFEFKSITLFLEQPLLRHYALENNIKEYGRYRGDMIQYVKPDRFIVAYFSSLRPYFDVPEKLTPSLASLKSYEAIELLISQGFEPLLFDFNEPYKIDLESYMLENFKFNIPLSEMARLTGRSLSTFKRDFKKKFDTTPQRWLTAKRLEEAYYLITKKQMRPSDIYYDLGFENFSHFSKVYNEAYR
ncbi:helix-turn-helix domain-containing protein [Mangrovibacterium sp.]|uniref:helix-turn-helix domain-containing protein n=1 Tax=Mangrovibacterium sp. TaxID=1961364 RepID=UPI00356A2AA4